LLFPKVLFFVELVTLGHPLNSGKLAGVRQPADHLLNHVVVSLIHQLNSSQQVNSTFELVALSPPAQFVRLPLSWWL